MKLNFKQIEKKWQKKWEQARVFKTGVDKKKPKYYLMEMFPYPSAQGLHLGHALNYTIGDILARFMRMKGFNVLYPMGFDALGLPAENAAIKEGAHPKTFTEQAVKNYIKQMKNLGLSYDWDKMVSSMEPEYYKWNQFFFLKFLEKGLAYRKKAAVNWCPECNTVLANEQVVGGCCWRHEDTEVEIKHLEQWFLKITDYADELLDCIDELKWPQKIKTMQKNWIGKSHGTEIDFEVETGNSGGKISNVVIIHGSNYNKEGSKKGKPENERHWKPWLKKELEKKGMEVSNELYPKDWLPDYEDWKKVFEKNKIDENSVLIGHSAGTAFILRWLAENKRKVKKVILVAPSIIKAGKYLRTSKLKDFEFDSSLKNYFDELIMFYSDDDDELIIKSTKKISKITGGKLIELKGKGHFIEKYMKTKEFPELLEEITSSQKTKFPIFTTRPDTLYGVTFIVISAQHPKLMELVTAEQEKEVEKFLKKIKSVSEKDQIDLEKEGVFTGSYAINPMTNERVGIWAGNFVVAEYGSGMVMGVPAHDQRDFDFARKYGIDIRQVVREKTARYFIIEKSLPKGKVKELEKFGEIKIEKDFGEWGKGIAVYVSLEKEKKLLEFLKKNLLKKSKEAEGWYANSGEFAIFNNKIIPIFDSFGVEEFKKYGRSLRIPEEQLDLDVDCFTGNGVLINSSQFNNFPSEKAKEEITKFLEKKNLGRKKVQFKLRDWLISRQRYWGTPIPIIYCDECGIVPVAEKDLPIKLPEKVKFGKGNPLATNEKFVNVKCPKCNGKARRETDTMDTFVDSSWYFMRYPDNKNSEKPFDKKISDYWLPVDQYIGGIEHAVMHLLYSRFWTKALRDLGFVKYDEPFLKLFNQGMLHGEDGEKMSKSKGNVILPEVVSEKYGIDTARFFLMSLAAPDKPRDWSDAGVQGSLKFINKIMDYFDKVKVGKSSAKIESKLNKTIKEVTEQIEDFKYNLAVIKIRDLFNSLGDEESKYVLEKSLKLLHVFCPHITEELWEGLGNKAFITTEKWPVADEKKIDERFEEEEKILGDIIKDIIHVKGIVGIENPKAYVYPVPPQFSLIEQNQEMLSIASGAIVIPCSVKDKNVYDPGGKSKKAKFGKPGIYLESAGTSVKV